MGRAKGEVKTMATEQPPAELSAHFVRINQPDDESIMQFAE